LSATSRLRSWCITLSSAIIVCALFTAIPTSTAGASWGWTGFDDVYPPHSPDEGLTGVQVERYDSIPSGVAQGAGNCSTILGADGNGTSQPFVYQDLVFAYLYDGNNAYQYFGTIHQCEGYEWYLFLDEYNSPTFGVLYANNGDKSTTGSTQHHFYEFVNNNNSNDVLAAQLDSTILWTVPQDDDLGIAVAGEILSTSQEAVTTYQGTSLNYDNNFGGWQSFDMSSGDTVGNGALNTSGTPAMCAYVVSPPSSEVANFGQNTSNMTNCT
jgi:hypothetical protein